MNAAAIIQMVLYLLQTVLGSLKSTTVTSELQTAIDGIEAAIAKLLEVKGTPVTYSQLESLRVDKKW